MPLANLLKELLFRLKGYGLNALHFVKKHPFKTLLCSLAGGAVSFLLFFLLTYFGAFGHIPTKEELKSYENPITSTIYGKDGKEIGVFYFQNRSNIDSLEVPKDIIHALVATEDARFYTHKGIDYKSYLRVLIKSVLLGQDTGGGSTITQQIAKNLFGRQKKRFLSTPINKMREIIIARRLENIYNKQELLLLYLNTVSFGENLYGLEKAAARFFNKTPQKLSTSECAILVGVLKAPTFYNPRNFPERAKNRRNVVLQQMVKYGYLSQQQADDAKDTIVLNYQPPVKQSSLSSYYKEFIRAEFDQWAQNNPKEDGTLYNVELDGLHIYTTLDPYVQKYLENAMTRQMKRLQNEMSRAWTSETVEGGKDELINQLIEAHPKIKQLRSKNATNAEIQQFINEKKERKYWELGVGLVSVTQSFKDSIVNTITRLHTGILAMNSQNGAIMGYLGGIDYGFSQIDHIREPKQVGSIFKPITYLAALSQGESPCKFYENKLRKYAKYEDWTPRNVDHTYGGSYSMHGALAKSINTVSVELQLRTGNDKVIEQAQKMGIKTEIPKVPSMVLGTAELPLFEMVQAYASIANGGRSVTPYIITRIEKDDGTLLFEKEKINKSERIASLTKVKVLQKMMRGVVAEGTAVGFNAYQIPFNIIGKTGTTQNNTDGWFIGCSPELVVGSWVGTLDKRVQFANGSGARSAMPMVASTFKSLSSWKKPILTNFEFEPSYFPCPAYSEMSAIDAIHHYADTLVYVRERYILDSILQDSIHKNATLDSLGLESQPMDTLKPITSAFNTY